MGATIISNQVTCHKCGDTIWSAHRHDYKSCRCGNISVDGGCSYARRGGPGLVDNSFTEQTIELDEVLVEFIHNTSNSIFNSHNYENIVVLIFASLTKLGYKIVDADNKCDEDDLLYQKLLGKPLMEAAKQAVESNCNGWGVANACIREIRDQGMKIVKDC